VARRRTRPDAQGWFAQIDGIVGVTERHRTDQDHESIMTAQDAPSHHKINAGPSWASVISCRKYNPRQVSGKDFRLLCRDSSRRWVAGVPAPHPLLSFHRRNRLQGGCR
jgi:hypothetical protein